MTAPELIIAKTPRLHPEIPILDLKNEHPTHRVAEVVQSTPGYGEVVVQEKDLCLITGPALTSHHPTPLESNDVVLWVGRLSAQEKLSLPWGEEHVLGLAKNHNFWHKVDGWIDEQQQKKDSTRFFLLLGHPHPNYPKDTEHVYPTGMQSLPAIHGHLSATIQRDKIDPNQIQEFDPNNKAHLFLLATFLTTGSESIEYLNGSFAPSAEFLQVFAQSFSFQKEKHTIFRPFFGFSGLAEAFSIAVQMQQSAKDLWLAHAIAFSQHNTPAALGALQLHLKQSCIPNMTLLSLNAEDQKLLGVSKDIKTVVFPFNLTNPQSLLDSVLLNRAVK